MASRSIIVRSSKSHHGRSQAKTGAQKKEHPLNTRNVVSIRRSVNPIANVLIYGIVRSFSRPHKINHTVTKVSRKWHCTCEHHTFRGVICRHIRAAKAKLAQRRAA